MTIARRLDLMFSDIRKDTCSARYYMRPATKDYEKYQVVEKRLRGKVSTFTSLLIDTLKGLGYSAHSSSETNYLMLDDEVVVDIGYYSFDIWSFNNVKYFIRVNDYNHDILPTLLPYDHEGDGVSMYCTQTAFDTLATITATIEAYGQCEGCHYSAESGNYCGLGIVPTGVCSHRKELEDND